MKQASTVRAAIIARVSTEEQARGASVDSQVADCLLFAQERGWRVDEAHIIREPGDSGRVVLFKRGKYQPRAGIARLLELVDHNEVDAVVASVQDRFHRNEYEFEILLRQHLWPAGIQVWTTDGELADTSVQEWRARKAAAQAAEEHSRNTSEKLRKANKRRRAQGKLVSGRPFGTMRGPDGIGRIRNPETFPYLLEIFERSAAGDSHHGIAVDFQRRGIPTVDGGLWWQATVRSIVTCRWYIGEIVHKGQPVIGQDGKPVVTEHDCMIPRALWEAAQRHKRAGRVSAYVYILQGLVKSTTCKYASPPGKAGQPADYDGKADRKHRPSYILRSEMNYHLECNQEGALPVKTYPAAELEKAVVERTIEVVENDELLIQARRDAEQLISDAASQVEQEAATVARLAKEQHTAEQRLARLLNLDMPEALRLADRQVQLAREQYEQHTAVLAELQRRAASKPELIVDGLEQLNLVRELWESGRRRELKQLLRTLIDHVALYPDRVHVEFRHLFKLGDEINIHADRGSSRRSA